MCVDTDLPNRLLRGEADRAEAYEERIVPRQGRPRLVLPAAHRAW